FFAAGVDFAEQVFGGNAGGECEQKPVVRLPKGYHLRAVHVVVAAVRIPFVLLVYYQRRFLKLPAHEAVMIIYRAIYEVTDDFLFAPFCRLRLCGKFVGADLRQQGRYCVAQKTESFQGCCYHISGGFLKLKFEKNQRVASFFTAVTKR